MSATDRSAVEADRRVVVAHELAEQLLAPRAALVDHDGVPRSHLRAIGDAGLLGLQAPVEDGGSAAPPAVFRRVVELLAGADCSTWFVQAQHHAPLQMLIRSDTPVRRRLAPRLARGELLSGVAFSHLRRWPERPVSATRVEDGWRFDGVAPWYTGWGLNDVMLLGGATEQGEVVFAFVQAAPGPGLVASEPLALAALSATATVRLTLDGLVAPDEDVVARLPIEEWAAADRRTTVNVNPAVLGLTERAVRLLGERARASGESSTAGAASRLAEALTEVRDRCYALLDDAGPDEAVAERLAARADAQHLMVEATSALVVAGAGGAMAVGAPAQRLAREALFLLVQAQTPQGRAATLDRWAR